MPPENEVIVENVDEIEQAVIEGHEDETSEENTETLETSEKEEDSSEEIASDEDTSIRPSVQDITKVYPDFFKKFPEMRHVYFRESEYSKVFPTIEDAKTASQDVDSLRQIESLLLSGKPEDAKSTLETLKEIGPEVLSNLALNFLPALEQLDNKSYYSVVTPIAADFIRELYSFGTRARNKNIQNAAIVASLHFFEDQGIATGEKKLNIASPKLSDTGTSKKDEVKTERDSILQERYDDLYQDVTESYISELRTAIEDGLDSEDSMTDYVKNALVQDIIKRIDRVLATDTNHKAKMKQLWEGAKGSRFNRQWKDRIKVAALSRAKSVMPAIRSKARAEALNVKERKEVTSPVNTNNKVKIVKNAVTSNNNGNTVKAKDLSQIAQYRGKIDYSKTSDEDILNGKVTLK